MVNLLFTLQQNEGDLSRKTGGIHLIRILLTTLLLVGFFWQKAEATTLTFNNTGCQQVKVMKVVLWWEEHAATLQPGGTWSTLTSWGTKYVLRNNNNVYLSEYVVPVGLFLTHSYNSGAAPAAPRIGTVTQPTCSVNTGSIQLTGLPAGNWTLTRNPGGVTTNGSGTSTTINGLPSGNYSFTVSNGTCTSGASASATIQSVAQSNQVLYLQHNVVTNVCPATTADLSKLVTSVPSGFSVSWHTASSPSASNKIANPAAVPTGTYYAVFVHNTAGCYGTKTTRVTVTTGSCNQLVRNKYRTLDGSNNNLTNSSTVRYGATGNIFARELPSDYADGISTLAGPQRPNPRSLSNRLSQELEDDHNDRSMSGLFYIWGQFIDHDMTDNQTNPADPANISLPSDEKLFTQPIRFSRTMAHPGTGINSPREQTNNNTAWLDGSHVYGLTKEHADWLRTFENGKMKTSAGDMLPFNTLSGEFDSPLDPNAPKMDDDANRTKKTFVAGDARVAEHPGLTSMHTLFVREHNRICDRLVKEGLKDDEEIYQRARKEIGALIQHITYTQWMTSMGIQLSPYTGYQPHVQPDILNTFSAAAYRWHTMVENDIILRDNECNGVGEVELPLRDIFFNISIVRNYDIGVIIKGLSVHRQYETDLKVNGGLRNFLAGNFGSDLVSINIQRGRDHGLPSYNTVREYYTGQRASTFEDVAVDSIAQKLKSIYNSVDDIDLWVGLMAEPRMPGKSIGRTLDAIVRSQFEKLRDGDYYYYLNDPELKPRLAAIQATKFHEIISRNSSAGNFQDNVFFRKFCSPEGDDIAKAPCNVVTEFTGWTYLGNSSHSKYYRWNGGQTDFEEAKETAISLGGTLPQISNLTENNTLTGYLKGTNVWLDMVRSGNSWRYSPVFNNDDILVQGSSVSYFKWDWLEPNNYNGIENRAELKGNGSWNDIAGTELRAVVSEISCDNVNLPCASGRSAPTLRSITKSNVCPATTIDLSTVTTSNQPLNTILTWHTGTPATNANRIMNITAVAPGTYYAAYYSNTAKCYSGSNGSATTAFTAVLKPCAVPPQISINDITVAENAGSALLTLTLNKPAAAAITVDFATLNGTATGALDYSIKSGTVTFAAGSTSTTIAIPITDDTNVESNETFSITLSNPNGATLAKSNGTVTITDNDVADPCAAKGGDKDKDGICALDDCDDNNANVGQKRTPGTACNDNNAATSNDVIQADGCTCAGTPSTAPNCDTDINIVASAGKITVSGLDRTPITSLQIFNSSWQEVFKCFGDCAGTVNTTVPNGTYYVYARYYTASYTVLCEKQSTVTVSSGAVCNNVTSGGKIGWGANCTSTVDFCPGSGSLGTINSCINPTGGSGVMETVWLVSTTSSNPPTTSAAQVAAGLDPHWKVISGATGLSYTPSNVTKTTYYLRCTRNSGCTEFIESNIIAVNIAAGCGGGGGGTPDCANIGISKGNASITITGLDGAPITSIHIFDAAYNTVYTCFANCNSPTSTYTVPKGKYHVYVKYFSARYEYLCEKDVVLDVPDANGRAAQAFALDAIKHIDHSELTWVHKGDDQVLEYTLQRSTDGVNFTNITPVAANRDAQASVYRAYDMQPVNGLNHYRVQLNLLDGTVGYSDVRTIAFRHAAAFTLFPNPATQYTNIQLESMQGLEEVQITVVNNLGIPMKQIQIDEVTDKFFQLDVSDLMEGHYTVWITNKNRRPVGAQLVVIRL